MKKTINLCIRLPPELYEKLKKVKNETGAPIHFQIIKALEEKYGIQPEKRVMV
jgi:predicted DNA-binding protein